MSSWLKRSTTNGRRSNLGGRFGIKRRSSTKERQIGRQKKHSMAGNTFVFLIVWKSGQIMSYSQQRFQHLLSDFFSKYPPLHPMWCTYLQLKSISILAIHWVQCFLLHTFNSVSIRSYVQWPCLILISPNGTTSFGQLTARQRQLAEARSKRRLANMTICPLWGYWCPRYFKKRFCI